MAFIRFLSAVLFSLVVVQASAAMQTRDTNSSDLTGDSICVELMCISATVFPNSTTQYNLSSTGSKTVGWIAMGFGSTMANSPMVIIWPNSDGSVTLSQRAAPAHVMPTVDSNPAREASLDVGLSNFASSNSNPSFIYTVPSVASTDAQAIVWAFATAAPDDSSPSATINEHIDAGTFNLNLTIPFTAGTVPTSSSGSGRSPQEEHVHMIRMHGIVCTIGFLGLLPLGALLARWLRTFSTRWFLGHWFIQTILSGPVIIAGVTLGILAVNLGQGMHLDDTHKNLGAALFVLYFAQLLFGAGIHFIKSRSATGRQPQNYAHALVGLTIIGLSYWQVGIGYSQEYPKTTGMTAPEAVAVVWIFWVAAIPVAYLMGLLLLRRQYRQESGIVMHPNGSSSAGIMQQEMRSTLRTE
ncbi:CBD9-like protein [Athelia psychrophila]|uniref:CBD9-like protein n=1 Tax=Athelia psychrophila TaxID=1759441 RepID=A0A166U3I8_9AGAM|nr:CBD9-like protein [Fibularhizoctonia sp. CBS 109695]